jgi:hypothetical protein
MLRTALIALAFVASPAVAQAPYYSAEPAAAPAEARLVVRDSVWRCSAGQCVAGRSPTRHALVCAGLARTVGELRRFAVEGREFDAEQLASCNRRAR